MAGGTWSSQNKVRPGVYIRFKSGTPLGLNVGERGTVTIPKALSWGPVGQVMTVEAGADMTPFTGYDATNEKNRFLNEIYKGSNRTAGPKTVFLYRLPAADAAAASVTSGTLTAKAKYPGVRGNDISVVITEMVDTPGVFTVSTVVDGKIVDQQAAEAADTLSANGYVTFSGTGALAATVGARLTGGTDGVVSPAAYSDYLAAIEPYKFDILIYDGSDAAVRDAMVTFIKRMADENGQYSQLVASGLTNPDSRYVINVESGVTLSDDTVLTAAEATWWVGGAQAGAKYNESLTYAAYPGAVAASPLMTNSQYAEALKSGKLVFFAEDGQVKVEQDINSLVSFTPDIGKVYRKNRAMRLCSTIANDIYQQFSANFLGVVNNNEDGRSRFKAAIVGYLLDIQANQGIQNFAAEDVEILPGEDVDAIIVNIAIQAVDAVEKIYMTIEIS